MTTISIIDFESMFNGLQNEFFGKQKKIIVDSSLKVYYGITTENYLRISFMSTIEPTNVKISSSPLVITIKLTQLDSKTITLSQT